jgi:hypothetical protein
MRRANTSSAFEPAEREDPSELAREIRVALENGDSDFVEDALWRLIEIDPHPERAQMLLALRLVKQGRYEESLRQTEEASAKLILSLRSAPHMAAPDDAVAPEDESDIVPHRLWRLTDARGSWVTLQADNTDAVRRWSHMELIATYATREEALRGLFEAQTQLREQGRDRRKSDDRRASSRTSQERRRAILPQVEPRQSGDI